jgi:predicted ArsR family transcriptional regulator
MEPAMTEEFDAQVQSIAALGEPVRRELYRYVVAQGSPTGREQAATAVGIPHHVAKFHLDRLVADGLLEVEYARPPGRSGPGAGRPAKLYRRAAQDISVSLPDRRYDLAGRVLAEAITIAMRDAAPLADALREAAGATGRHIGAEASQSIDRTRDRIDTVIEVLARNGYEPRTAERDVILANCPFHSLAETYTQLVCGMNVHLIGGFLEGLGAPELRARLEPGEGRCCVAIGTGTPS